MLRGIRRDPNSYILAHLGGFNMDRHLVWGPDTAAAMQHRFWVGEGRPPCQPQVLDASLPAAALTC